MGLLWTLPVYAQTNTPFEQYDASIQEDAQNKIRDLFDSLETVGAASNSGGNKAAGLAALDVGCHKSLDYLLQTNLYHDLKPDILSSHPSDSQAKSWLLSKGTTLRNRAMESFCMALRGEKLPQIDVAQSLRTAAREEVFPLLMMQGVDMAHQSNLPFLTNIEVELGNREDTLISSITSIQPLWKDVENGQYLFSQVSWYNAPETRNDEGFKTQYDTLNLGVAYRFLSKDEKYLYGVNAFFDHVPQRGHNRASLGIDARTSQLAMSANRYVPLSSWRSLDQYYEDRPSAGWDMELRGQVPQLPSWTASLKGYEWDEQDDGEDLYGATAHLEYSPVPAMALRIGGRDDSQNNPSFEAALRFHWRFDQPQDLQWKQKTHLAPVRDYVYEKVHRENIVRVSVRRRDSSKLVVIETSGSNTAVEKTGSSSLSIGQTLLMPVTVTTANTAGAYTRLRLSLGGTLTLGRNTQVVIVPDLITLVTGTIQYVSDGNIKTVSVPGGTIELHGTDIDAVSDGTDTSVRVRDGSVTFTGTSSGSVALSPEEMAKSVSGVVGTIASGSAAYIMHTDKVSAQIDRVALPLSNSAAPYPYEVPRIVSENLTPGQDVVIGLRFSSAVTVSGGTPLLNLTINGNPGTASLSGGSGTNDLSFTYTVQAADGGATSLTITSLDNNGATITGNGKTAVTTIADATLTLSGSVSDVTAPSGYAVAFTTSSVNIANVAAAAFDITSAEVGSTYSFTISSSGGGTPVTGSGTISSATESITGLNLSGLNDGTLTVSATLTDPSSNVGSPVTNTATKDVVAPTITSVTPPASTTYEP